jgi:hypothetical protein
MAIKSKTVRAAVTGTSYIDVLINANVYDPLYIGQIDVVNKSTTDNTIEISVLSGGENYPLLKILVQRDYSRVTDERKIPYTLQPNEKIQAKLMTADATGMVVHLSYI